MGIIKTRYKLYFYPKLILFTFLLFYFTTLFAQKKSSNKFPQKRDCGGVTMQRQFKVGDSMITCNSCNWDECGNVINKKNGDTLYKNTGIVFPIFFPIYLTTDSIILTKKQIIDLFDKNNIRSMQFYHCNDVAQKMGFLAIEGLYIIQLKDTTLSWRPLIDAVREECKDSSILNNQLLINGYKPNTDCLKYTSENKISIIYLDKSNLYCIRTE